MSKAKLRQYSGELDAAQISCGMNAACRNARRLADDARLLLDAGRYPTAASLAALSIEESGKASVLRGLALAPTEEARRRAWKDYRSHRSKNAAWILPELAAKGARDLEALRLAADPSAEHTATLRNRIGDAHGQGRNPVRPAPRHAALAVNLAGSVATFLVETWQGKQEA